MPTTATLKYTAVPVLVTPAKLVGEMNAAAIALPTSDLIPFGVSLTSDTTSVVGGNAVRQIVFSLLPIFTQFAAPVGPPVQAGYNASIVSSNPADTMQMLVIATDTNGLPITLTPSLKGTTPVPFIGMSGSPQQFPLTQTFATKGPWGSVGIGPITSVAPLNGPAPAGMISIYSSPNATNGTVAYQSPPSFGTGWQGSIVSTSKGDTGTVTVSYHDDTGAPQVEVMTLNGTTPVPLTALNHSVITNMVPTFDNIGTVSIFQGEKADGGIAGQITPSFSASFPNASSRVGLFSQLYLQILSANVQTQMTESITIV